MKEKSQAYTDVQGGGGPEPEALIRFEKILNFITWITLALAAAHPIDHFYN